MVSVVDPSEKEDPIDGVSITIPCRVAFADVTFGNTLSSQFWTYAFREAGVVRSPTRGHELRGIVAIDSRRSRGT